ncbi:MAG: serine/threonine-protein kinase [Cyanobacteriota bacterium]
MPLYCSQGHENDSRNRFCKDCGQRLPLGFGQVLEKRYSIVNQLGQGGFGRTYLAEALHRFNERCVLKEFAPQVQGAAQLQKAKELFEREAGVLHQLQHPQLPRFWELFQADMGGGMGCLFLVQDYVEGSTYFDLLKSGKRLSEAEVMQMMCQILPVLAYIHAKGVIHRDISPDNIILRQSDQIPVLIDFGGVKQIATTAVSNLTNLGVLQTRIGKKGYAPEEQIRKGEVFVNSDLYSLAVTALVLLTGKEPQHLYDIYKGSWHWGREIQVSPQLETVLKKMLAYRPSDRFPSANEVLQAIQSQLPSSPTPAPTPSNSSQTQTKAVAPSTQPAPIQASSQSVPRTFMSRIQTLVFAPKALPKLNPATPSPIAPNPNTQAIHPNPNHPVIQQPPQFFNWIGKGLLKVGVGVGFILLTGFAGWAVMNSVMRSNHFDPLVERSLDNTSSHSPNATEQKQIDQLLSRRQDLEIPEGFFNQFVNESFYAKHPEARGRSLTMNPEDAALRNDWYNTAKDLLDKLEQAQLSAEARRQLGSYVQKDYRTWQRQAKQGQLGGYTIDQLSQQTEKKFRELFPEQQGAKQNVQTFGQIWYAIFADRASQLETGKQP